MDFWKEYLATLGGTATGLIILGSLFTWTIQHRLNRQLEYFKTQLQTNLLKLPYRFTHAADTATEVMKRAVEVETLANKLTFLRTYPLEAQQNKILDNIKSLQAEIEKKLSDFVDYSDTVRHLFHNEAIATYSHAHVSVVRSKPDLSERERTVILMDLRDKRGAMSNQFSKLLE